MKRPPLDTPPQRYRVIERGRRLQVIDQSQAGIPGRHHEAALPPAQPARTGLIGSGGGTTLTTKALYDAKGPREIRLGAEGVRMVEAIRIGGIATLVVAVAMVMWNPTLIVIAFVLFSKPLRDHGRAAVTKWLDTLDRGD